MRACILTHPIGVVVKSSQNKKDFKDPKVLKVLTLYSVS